MSGNFPEKKLTFLLVVICDRFQEYELRFEILCNLLDLEFPEMGSFDLDLPPGYRNDAVLGLLDTFADFLAFTNIDLHGSSSPGRAFTLIWRPHVPAGLIYQLVYDPLYLSLVIVVVGYHEETI